MEKNYQNYSVEDFTQDPSFINWVRTKENDKFWTNFVHQNPTKKEQINTALEIVQLFKSVDHPVRSSEIHSVWKRVETIHKQHHRPQSKSIVLKLSRYAAIFLLPILLGGLIWGAYTFTQNNRIVAQLNKPVGTEKQAKLILDDGDEVVLEQKQNELQINQQGDQIQINEDSVIHHQSIEKKNAMAQIIIPYGKTSKVELSDGTVVWMNAGSKLVFPQKFENKQRKVFLVGEAYFDVAKDKTRPFTVTTPSINVTVLGTEFNLRDNSTEDESEVVLVEGAVSLKENSLLNILNKEIKLSPRQRASFDKEGRKTTVQSGIDVDYYISWREGIVRCERENILKVFHRLEQYYDVRFRIENNMSRDQNFSGKLDLNQSIDDILKVMSDAAPFNYKIENRTIFITNKNKRLPMR